MSRRRDQITGATAVGPDHSDPASCRVGPCRVNDPLSVRREGGGELDAVVSREPPGRFEGKFLQIEPTQRRVSHEAAPARRGDVAQHLHVESRRSHVLLEAQRLVNRLIHLRGKGDDFRRSRGYVHEPDLTLAPNHDPAAVGCPVVLCVDAVDGPGFLHVAVQPLEDRPILSGGKVVQEEHRVLSNTPYEGELRPVR